MNWETNYEIWKKNPTLDPLLSEELNRLKDNPKELEDAFYAPLEFGTAGMRGILGPGINRMNIYTVRQATEGLARFMESQSPEVKEQGVAIAFDSRHFSEEFALEAARTLAYHNITSYVFESLRPTPELSFAVRHLNTFAGIMITASHNPAKYNGYKVYGADGGQMPPKDADALTEYVRQVTDLFAIQVLPEAEVKNTKRIHIIGEEVDQAYLKEVKTVTIDEKLVAEMGENLSLVYTPLHGTGRMLGERALKQAGFEKFVLVPEQAIPDPEFTTVKSPNPEEAGAFTYAIALGKEVAADLLVATDPDADRLGAAVRLPNGDYQVLTGNQIAALLTHYILTAKQAAKDLPENAVIVKSIVSSEFPAAIARSFKVKTINVLTGFKFIAEKIQQFQENHQHTFEFGFEESYGYLIKPFVRDKDAIQTLVLLAEVAAFYKKQGKTLYDGLEELFATVGYYQENTTSVVKDGISGSEEIAAIMADLRKEAPKEFAGIKVVSYEDYQNQRQFSYVTGKESQLAFPTSNVLKYYLADDSFIAVRPSGTEPKIKFYIGVKGTSHKDATEKINHLKASLETLTSK